MFFFISINFRSYSTLVNDYIYVNINKIEIKNRNENENEYEDVNDSM